MTDTPVLKSDASPTTLLAQADLLLAAIAFLRPPDRLVLPEVDEVDELLEAAEADASVRIALGEAMLAAREAAVSPQVSRNAVCWADEYHRLFEGAMACPPNESAFIRRDKGAILADIMGFYQAFGFTASAQAGEKADHLCCELEFVAALLVMWSCARQQQDTERQDVTRWALASFAEAHVGAWLGSFIARVRVVTASPVFSAAVTLLERTWQMLVLHHGWVSPAAAMLEPAAPDGTPYECGMAEAQERIGLTIGGRAVTPPPDGVGPQRDIE